MMSRTLAAVIALGFAALAGCSIGTPDTVEDAARAGQPTPAATAPKPLELVTAARNTELCSHNRGRPDLAWYDLAVKVHGEADWVDLGLVNPEGLRIVGPPTVIPAVNFGGRIDAGGFALWSDRNTVAGSHQVQWGSRESMEFWTPTEGQTAMLMMRLRFTDDEASFDGVKATYQLPNGETGSTTVKMPVSIKHFPACRG